MGLTPIIANNLRLEAGLSSQVKNAHARAPKKNQGSGQGKGPETAWAHLTFTFPDPPKGNNGKYLRQPLHIVTGADAISWTYGLNTARIPTYAGEVVQILSCYINNLQVSGTVAQYSTGRYDHPGAEQIHKWFLQYMQYASQSSKTYTESPIHMHYAERNWDIDIQVLGLPSFRMSRDLVAPQWSITGKVVQAPDKMLALTLDSVLSGTDAQAFAQIADGVNLKYPDPAHNPWSSPFPGIDKKLEQQQYNQAMTNLGGYWSQLVSSWTSGNVNLVQEFEDAGKPPDLLTPLKKK